MFSYLPTPAPGLGEGERLWCRRLTFHSRSLQTRPSAVSSQRINESSRRSFAVDHQERSSERSGIRRQLESKRPLPHQFDQVAPLRLHDLVHVDTGKPGNHQDLDHQLIREAGMRSPGGTEPLGTDSAAPPP